MKYRFSDQPLFNRFARRLTADGDTAPGAGGPPPAAAEGAPPAAGGAAPAAGAAPEPTSLLSAAPSGDAPPAADPAPAPQETEEQKAERLKNETPEQKAEREAKEATARAEAMKPYDALKLPDGMPADQPAFVDFKNQALDLGVEPEKAQKLIDTVAPKMKEAMEAPYNLWADTQEKWVAEIKADPVIGKDLDKNIAIAARAIDGYGTPEEGKAVRNALAFTGAGNNPDIIRWMHRVGVKMGEGKPVQAAAAPAAKPSLAQQMYPTMGQTAST